MIPVILTVWIAGTVSQGIFGLILMSAGDGSGFHSNDYRMKWDRTFARGKALCKAAPLWPLCLLILPGFCIGSIREALA